MTGSLLVGVCNHSTSADLEKELALHDVIHKACAACNNVVIFGDFNHRSIDWKRMQAGAEGARFLELTHNLFLTQHVHVETRAENILDLISSTEPNMIDAVRVKESFSDHNIVTCDATVWVQVKEWRETCYDYKRGNYEEMFKGLTGNRHSRTLTKTQNGINLKLWLTLLCSVLSLSQQRKGT